MLTLCGPAVWLGVASGAGPAEPPGWLSWDAPATCPDATYLQEAVEERLGRSPGASEIDVQATVVDDGPRGLHLDLATTPTGGATDVRRLEAHDCRALADAAALLVALSVDPVAVAAISAARAEAQAETSEATGDPAGDPVARESVPVPSVEPPRDATSPEDEALGSVHADARMAEPPRRSFVPREVLLHAAGGPEIGALPGVAGGATAAVGLGWSRLRVEVGATWIGVRREAGELASVRVQMAAAVLRACARVGSGRIEVPLCGGLDLGAVRGAGQGGVGTRTAVGPWIAPHVVAGVHGWVRSRLAVFGRVEVAVPALSTAFVAVDPGPEVELFRTGPVSARLWVGLEVKIPIGRDGTAQSRRMDRGRS